MLVMLPAGSLFRFGSYPETPLSFLHSGEVLPLGQPSHPRLESGEGWINGTGWLPGPTLRRGGQIGSALK